MSAPPSPWHPGRSVAATVAGLAATAAPATLVDGILRAAGLYPTDVPMSEAMFAVAAAYRLLFAGLGGWVVARLAPRKPRAHALVLGGVGALLALGGTLATWNEGPMFGPKWYPLLLVVTALPCAWVGGIVATRRSAGT